MECKTNEPSSSWWVCFMMFHMHVSKFLKGDTSLTSCYLGSCVPLLFSVGIVFSLLLYVFTYFLYYSCFCMDLFCTSYCLGHDKLSHHIILCIFLDTLVPKRLIAVMLLLFDAITFFEHVSFYYNTQQLQTKSAS